MYASTTWLSDGIVSFESFSIHNSFFLQSQTHSEGEEQQAIIAICVQLFIFIKLIARHNMHTHTHTCSHEEETLNCDSFSSAKT